MDKTRMTDADRLKICRNYYVIGFFFLPMVWALNYFWFTLEADTEVEYEEKKEIRKLRRRSGIGALLWLVIITIWVILFQTNRVKWGDFGDNISFIIPTGSP